MLKLLWLVELEEGGDRYGPIRGGNMPLKLWLKVQVEGSPEWQAYKNAELAFIAPSVGPLPATNVAQAQLNHVGPAPGPVAGLNWHQEQLNYQQQALNFIANGGR